MNLDKGILLEDTGQLLEWGRSVEKLATLTKSNKEIRPDRTIYHWGTHQILNGLTLNLTSPFWVFEDERKLSSVEHWAIGDKQSHDGFLKISRHLIERFGNPYSKDESRPPEQSWIWKLKDITIHLYLLEQHVFKLSLTIKKGNNEI